MSRCNPLISYRFTLLRERYVSSREGWGPLYLFISFWAKDVTI